MLELGGEAGLVIAERRGVPEAESLKVQPTTTLDAARTELGLFSVCWGWQRESDLRGIHGCTRNTGLRSHSAPQAASGRPASPHESAQKRVAAVDCGAGGSPACAIHGAHPRAPVCLLRVNGGHQTHGIGICDRSNNVARLSRALESQTASQRWPRLHVRPGLSPCAKSGTTGPVPL